MRTPRLARVPATLAALAVLAVAAPADVLTVAPSGADYTQIQPAVDESQAGDTILVMPGSYDQFGIFDRSLSVVADQPGTVQISGKVRVQNLAPGRRVVISGIDVAANGEHAFLVWDNQGSVHVQQSTFVGSDGATLCAYPESWEALTVRNSSNLALVDCTLTGGDGYFGLCPTSGAPAIFARDSTVTLYGCTLQGGQGGFDPFEEAYDGGNGGHGYQAPTGFLFAAGSNFHGGHGGDGSEEDGGPPPFGTAAGDGGDGGHGIYLGSFTSGAAPSDAVLMDNVTTGGFGGQGGLGFYFPSGNPGAMGQGEFLLTNATSTELSGTARVFGAPTVVREGDPVTLSVQGAPGDSVYLLQSPAPGYHLSIPFQGVVLLGGLPSLKQAGVIPSNGTLQRSFPASDLGPGVQAGLTRMQMWLSGPSGITLTNPVALTILDAQL